MEPYSYSASRTVVDKDGNCWVANRNYGGFWGSMTQVVTSGGIDWNNNSIIDTPPTPTTTADRPGNPALGSG
jgi:hypothetical protein